jgi:hypothetical protein
MKRNVLFAGIVTLASVFFFQGISMAGACKKLGLTAPCVSTGDIKKRAVTNVRIDKDSIKLNRMDESVAGVNGNGMVKAWARINADGTVASCWRCNQDTNETRRLAMGGYEVDFTPLSTDIRGRPRMAILDAFGAIYSFAGGGIRVSDNFADPSSVIVNIYDPDGNDQDSSFDLIIF